MPKAPLSQLQLGGPRRQPGSRQGSQVLAAKKARHGDMVRPIFGDRIIPPFLPGWVRGSPEIFVDSFCRGKLVIQ